jgi:hypothetical protein
VAPGRRVPSRGAGPRARPASGRPGKASRRPATSGPCPRGAEARPRGAPPPRRAASSKSSWRAGAMTGSRPALAVAVTRPRGRRAPAGSPPRAASSPGSESAARSGLRRSSPRVTSMPSRSGTSCPSPPTRRLSARRRVCRETGKWASRKIRGRFETSNHDAGRRRARFATGEPRRELPRRAARAAPRSIPGAATLFSRDEAGAAARRSRFPRVDPRSGWPGSSFADAKPRCPGPGPGCPGPTRSVQSIVDRGAGGSRVSPRL